MKNSSGLLLLPFILLLSLTLSAVELHIPPRPTQAVCDYAKIFNNTDLGLLDASLDLYRIKHGEPVYILTVPADYLSQMDTFAKLVPAAWGVGDTDRATILILTAGSDNSVYVVPSPYNADMTPLSAAYLSIVKFQHYLSRSNSLAISDFLDDLGDGKLDPAALEQDISYKDFVKTYDPKLPFAEQLKKYESHFGRYFLLFLLGIVLIVILVKLYRSRSRSTTSPSAPASNPYRQVRGVSPKKSQINIQKRTTPANTPMGKGPRSGAGGAAAGAAGLLAGAALINAMNDDDGGDDDDSGDYSDGSSDYSSDSSDYSSGSDYSSDSSDYSSGDDY